MIGEIWLGIASVSMLLGAVGLFRFRDFYLRVHAATMVTVGGVCLSLLYFALSQFWSVFTLKILLIICFILLVSPTGTHAIARAAYRTGVKPKKLSRDDLKQKAGEKK
jgi:multicomponent Na+:H+ antiporter subunit G